MDKQEGMRALVDYAVTNNVSNAQIDMARAILKLLEAANFPDGKDTIKALELAAIALETMSK